MTKRKRRSSNIPIFIVLLIIACLIFSNFLTPHRLGLVVPGWEIYDQVGAIRHNDVIYSEASQFTHPKELMGVYWKVDMDEENYQVPTIFVELGDISHVDFMGKPIPNEQCAGTMEVTRVNHTYYLDYHIYMYTITIRTIADYNHYKGGGLTLPHFEHETSWPYETFNGPLGGVVGEGRIGEEFVGGVYTKFVISPWTGATYRNPPNSSYVLQECWAGVMNTYVFDRELGQVANQWGDEITPDPAAPLFVGAGLDRGNQVPMFEDDGSFGTPAPIVDWGPSVTPDTRIKSTVVQYLPVQMSPGCFVYLDWFGCCQDLSPCDVAVQYTLRVDVLQTHDFVLETAYEPPEPEWPSDYFSWAESFWTIILGGLNPFAIFGPYAPLVAFIALLVIGGIVVLALLAIFAPLALGRLFGGIGKARHAYKAGREGG